MRAVVLRSRVGERLAYGREPELPVDAAVDHRHPRHARLVFDKPGRLPQCQIHSFRICDTARVAFSIEGDF